MIGRGTGRIDTERGIKEPGFLARHPTILIKPLIAISIGGLAAAIITSIILPRYTSKDYIPERPVAEDHQRSSFEVNLENIYPTQIPSAQGTLEPQLRYAYSQENLDRLGIQEDSLQVGINTSRGFFPFSTSQVHPASDYVSVNWGESIYVQRFYDWFKEQERESGR